MRPKPTVWCRLKGWSPIPSVDKSLHSFRCPDGLQLPKLPFRRIDIIKIPEKWPNDTNLHFLCQKAVPPGCQLQKRRGYLSGLAIRSFLPKFVQISEKMMSRKTDERTLKREHPRFVKCEFASKLN